MITTAQEQFAGGWGGSDYRRFTELALETFRPLHNDSTDAELVDTYKFHGSIDFLRMLGYGIPVPDEIGPIVQRLSGRENVRIVDYGCGLAHRTIAVSRALILADQDVKLVLVDIRRPHHFEFLEFLCEKYGIDLDFIEVDSNRLYPDVPAHDYCDAVSVLEHVRHPLRVIENIHRTLRPGGLLLASVEDEIEEMMHVSPDLAPVRAQLRDLGYLRVTECCGAGLFQKP